MPGWHTPTNFVAGTVVTEAMLDDLSALLTTGVTVPIAESILSSSAGSIDFTSIPQTYRSLAVCISGRTDGATSFSVRLNNDAGGGNYTYELVGTSGLGALQTFESTGTSSMLVGSVSSPSAVANGVGGYWIVFPNYANSTLSKGMIAVGGFRGASGSGGTTVNIGFGHWVSQSAITRITFILTSGNFVAGTGATLYGLPMLG